MSKKKLVVRILSFPLIAAGFLLHWLVLGWIVWVLDQIDDAWDGLLSGTCR